MKYIDAIACPICKETRLWKVEGDFSDTRMANGSISCKNSHKWFISEEVLRLDHENSDEDMLVLDRPLTGFPKSIEEEVRGGFLQAFGEYVQKFVNSGSGPMILIGQPILFMNYLKHTERDLIIINSDEGILRQVQELAVRLRIYRQTSIIRAEIADFILPEAQILYLFDSIPDNLVNNEQAIIVNRDASAEIIWEERSSILMLKTGII